MSNRIMLTGVWNGEEHTKCIAEWSRMTFKSTSFIQRRINYAREHGIKPEMEYVISEIKRVLREKPKAYRREVSTKMKGGGEGVRLTREANFAEQHAEEWKSFLYPKGVEVQPERNERHRIA